MMLPRNLSLSLASRQRTVGEIERKRKGQCILATFTSAIKYLSLRWRRQRCVSLVASLPVPSPTSSSLKSWSSKFPSHRCDGNRNNGNSDNISLNSITLRVSPSSVWQAAWSSVDNDDDENVATSRGHPILRLVIVVAVVVESLAFKIPHLMCLELPLLLPLPLPLTLPWPCFCLVFSLLLFSQPK